MRCARLSFLVVALLLAAAPSPGQQPKPDEPEFAKHLFPPELVLKYAGQIGLKPAQRTTIVEAIKKVQGDLVDLQLQMAEPAEALNTLMERPQVDEAAALAQVEKILTLERDIKKMQLSLLVRIKNALTPEQQNKLHMLRE